MVKQPGYFFWEIGQVDVVYACATALEVCFRKTELGAHFCDEQDV